ncbi:MAG: NADH-quinone oxidoreductase subunit NuoK [Deltaproteobacteria bacterium]|nr:NADH-quinone oxidoreductase subunit NuoK [Deltaproteobacteria bacterium]
MSFTVLSPAHFLVVAAVIFAIGTAGAILRRNALTLLMSVELMLNAANLLFLGYAREYGHAGGHAIAFFVMAIAAAEAAIGLAILIGVFRTRQTVEVDELDLLRDET